MIEEHDRVILVGEGRTYYVRAGSGQLSTDKGIIDLRSLVGRSPGDIIASHLGTEFTVRVPRPTDFFHHAKRSGAPMLPKDIGMVIAGTGMNNHDRVLDAGTGTGVASIFFGGIAQEVISYEIREKFAEIARQNIRDAKLSNVTIITGDILSETGTFDIVHLDLHLEEKHIQHAYELLCPGGYLATYTPFLEQTFRVIDTANVLFSETECHELLERTLTRTERGTRPSTRVCHTGYITIARKL